MKQKKETYLSDDQLLKLIAEVEEQELVQAPGDILTCVLQKAEAKEQNAGTEKPKTVVTEIATVEEPVRTERRAVPARRRMEFQRYCIRVVTSMAAAIVLVFLLPGLDSVRQEAEHAKQDLISQQKEVISEQKEMLSHKQQEESLMGKIGDCRVIRDGQLLSIIKELGGK